MSYTSIKDMTRQEFLNFISDNRITHTVIKNKLHGQSISRALTSIKKGSDKGYEILVRHDAFTCDRIDRVIHELMAEVVNISVLHVKFEDIIGINAGPMIMTMRYYETLEGMDIGVTVIEFQRCVITNLMVCYNVTKKYRDTKTEM